MPFVVKPRTLVGPPRKSRSERWVPVDLLRGKTMPVRVTNEPY
jgi:hypothetical protein